jgi:signal peptidase
MEKDKKIQIKRILNLISKIISYTLLALLVLIGILLILYVVSSKIAEKKGEKAPFALYTIISPSMTPNIKVYDVVVVKKVDISTLKKNDIITFYSTNSFFGTTPITHRIVELLVDPDDGSVTYRVKGDANSKADEEKVLPINVVGKVIFKIPQLGSIQFFLASKSGWIIAVMIPALAVISYDIYKIFRLILLKSKLLDMENKHGNI